MSESNLGRVQGGGFFGSTSTSATSILKTTVQTNGVSPLVGDSIINANGDVCRIGAITSTAYTVTKYGSIKGKDGTNGTNGKDGAAGTAAGFGTPTATAHELEVGSAPTVSVQTSGTDQKRVFGFDFGIPTGAKKTVTINGSKITMAEFVANCKKGSYNVIGTEATIENFIGGQTVTVRLIGTNHDVDALVGNTIKTTWETVTTLCQSYLGLPFDYYDNQSSGTTYPSNMHGYRTAVDLQRTLETIFGMLDPELQRGIVLASKPCYVKRKYRTTSGDQGGLENAAFHLFLLSATEIGAGTNTWFETEGTPYAYYADLNSVDSVETREKLNMKVQSDVYWLRTAYKSLPSYWMYVGEGGNVNNNSTNYCWGLAPAFCI